jgi:hypothetical protein
MYTGMRSKTPIGENPFIPELIYSLRKESLNLRYNKLDQVLRDLFILGQFSIEIKEVV